MIKQGISTKHKTVRRPVSGSFFSMVGQFIKEEIGRKRCRRCYWTGFQTCSSCKGKGVNPGEVWFIQGCSAVCPQPCRRCIGTGREECRCCRDAGSVAGASNPHY